MYDESKAFQASEKCMLNVKIDGNCRVYSRMVCVIMSLFLFSKNVSTSATFCAFQILFLLF